MTQIIHALSDISDQYDALFCDLWGCLHNGIAPIPGAPEALKAFRDKGGVVALVTNAPRARAKVEHHLDRLGVPRDCWDVVVTSGDSARATMYRGAVGEKIYFIGEARDQSFFEPLKVIEDPVRISQVPLEEAEGIVCTGLRDPYDDLDSYRAELLYAKTNGLKLLCANPDIVVDLGESRQWCAGALAGLYTEMGGESLYFGKPHPPIYDLARRRLAALGREVSNDRILAVGDGIATDVAGGMGEDVDVLFITGGLAASETGTDQSPDPDALNTYLQAAGYSPRYAIGFLG